MCECKWTAYEYEYGKNIEALWQYRYLILGLSHKNLPELLYLLFCSVSELTG